MPARAVRHHGHLQLRKLAVAMAAAGGRHPGEGKTHLGILQGVGVNLAS